VNDLTNNLHQPQLNLTPQSPQTTLRNINIALPLQSTSLSMTSPMMDPNQPIIHNMLPHNTIQEPNSTILGPSMGGLSLSGIPTLLGNIGLSTTQHGNNSGVLNPGLSNNSILGPPMTLLGHNGNNNHHSIGAGAGQTGAPAKNDIWTPFYY